MNIQPDYRDKPYYSLDAYFKNKYGEKCYKIAVDAGCTCPNRDGMLDSRGCIFCSAGGSGDFAVSISESKANAVDYIESCIEKGIAKFNKTVGEKFVIYFQAYTNTYGNLEWLSSLWKAALSNERVVGISIATRPDCIGDDVIEALHTTKEYADSMDKFVWVELGLQTIHRQTEMYIRRHFSLMAYDDACAKLYKLNIPFITHVILGLPGENFDMMKYTVRYVCEGSYLFEESDLDEEESNGGLRHIIPFGIKLQLLHVLEGTDLATDYREGKFSVMDMDTYIDLVCDLVEIIPHNVVIHRITGDGPKNILLAPSWSGNKKLVLNTLHKRMKERAVIQGSKA